MIFTHFSDLDSATHKNSLHSAEAQEAIERDEILLEKFMDTLMATEERLKQAGEDIMLIVTSDHGLIDNGHGGDSANERLSMLFAYSSRGFASNKQHSGTKEDLKFS